MRQYQAKDFYTAMSDTYRQLTGFAAEAASDVGIRMRALAEELARLGGEMEEIRRDIFPQTSGGKALDYHGELWGITRRPPEAAGGTLRFYRATPATAPITIAKGVVCSDQSGKVAFATTQAGKIPEGGKWADIPAVAVNPGEEGNLPPGAVCAMVGSAPGVAGVTNPAAMAGGLAAEDDEHIRGRVLTCIKAPPNGVNAAWYREEALRWPGVRSAGVLPAHQGVGTVDVAIALHEGYHPLETAAALQGHFEEMREIGTKVTVTPAEELREDVAALVMPQPGHGKEEVAAACNLAVADYLAGLAVGEPLYLAGLTSRLMAAPGVANLRILAPIRDRIPEAGQLLCAGEITVEGVDSL